VQFVAFWPYAHTPDYVGEGKNDGKKISSYSGFKNMEQWRAVSGLTDGKVCQGENFGELPAYFLMIAPNEIAKPNSPNLTFKVGNLSITVPAKTSTIVEEVDENGEKIVKTEYTHHSEIQWDSKTGIVSAMVNNKRKPIMYIGDSLGTIPVSDKKVEVSINDGILKYHYWYY
jgi:hypothetical protein